MFKDSTSRKRCEGVTQASAPVDDVNRLELLDALRGFALLGVLFANLSLDWAGWGLIGESKQQALAGDSGAAAFNFISQAFVDGKFYTIFSLLFGVGFAMQIDALERRGNGSVYLRRLTVLFLIGALHMTAIWLGDILAPYAVVGFFLYLIRRLSDRTLLWLAVALITFPVFGQSFVAITNADMSLGFYDREMAVYAAMGVEPYIGGDSFEDYIERRAEEPDFLLASQLSGPLYRIGYLFESWRFFKLAGIMIIGMWVGRKLVRETLLSRPGLIKRVLVAALAVGLPSTLLYGAMGGLALSRDWNGVISAALYALSVVPMGLAYASIFALIWMRHSSLLRVFAAPGRMALTNYLSHSMIGLVFFNLLFRWTGTLNPVQIVTSVAVIFALQTVFSRWWLSRFRYGPMEWLWRSLTYGTSQPIRRATATSS